MQKKIQDIAIIRSGVYVKEVPEGEACYLQVNNFDKGSGAFLLPEPTLELDNKIESHLLLEGDVVFAAKGTSNFCVVFHEEMGKVVASSSLLVVRIVDQSIVHPDYLCWYLNREDTIGFLKANATGTSIPSISKALIEECAINIPSMCVQSNIVAINQLQQREQRIYNEVTNLRNKLIQKQLIEKTK